MNVDASLVWTAVIVFPIALIIWFGGININKDQNKK